MNVGFYWFHVEIHDPIGPIDNFLLVLLVLMVSIGPIGFYLALVLLVSIDFNWSY